MKRTMISLGLTWMVGHAVAAIRPRYVDVVARSFEHDLVNCVDDSIVGIFLLLLFNLSKLLAVFSLRYCSWIRLN